MMRTDCDRQAPPWQAVSPGMLTDGQEGEGFIADDDDEEEEEVAERRRRRKKKRKNREAEEALDDEDLDLIGVEVERPAEEQVRHTLLEPGHD